MSASDVLEQVQSGIDALCGLDPGIISDGDTLVGLSHAFDRLEAVLTRATARFDADGGYAASGARSAADWGLQRQSRWLCCKMESNRGGFT